MKIVVCVKHVPSGRLWVDAGSNTLDRSGPAEMNKADRYAVEEALRVKESIPGSEVVALSLGPTGAQETLRTALALGADRAVLISDPQAAGSDLIGTAQIVAKALDREQPDLVLFGQQSGDGVGGVLWAAVADLMRRPYASQAAEVTVGEQTLRVTRQTESGDEEIEVPLPALLSVGDSINEPRYTSLKGVMGAKKKPLETVTLGDLGLDPTHAGQAGARTVVLGTGTPPARAGGVRVEDEAAAAQAIVDFLAEKELV